MAEGYEHTDQREHYFWLEESNMIGMEVGNEEYAMLCPHCSPSYFLYKPGIKKSEICHNAHPVLRSEPVSGAQLAGSGRKILLPRITE